MEPHLPHLSMEDFPAGLVGRLTNVSKLASISHGNEYVFSKGLSASCLNFLAGTVDHFESGEWGR